MAGIGVEGLKATVVAAMHDAAMVTLKAVVVDASSFSGTSMMVTSSVLVGGSMVPQAHACAFMMCRVFKRV